MLDWYFSWQAQHVVKFWGIPGPRNVVLFHTERTGRFIDQSNVTICCACHDKRLRCLILVSHETSSTMRTAPGLILQLHQVLHLPRNFKFKISAANPWIMYCYIFYCSLNFTLRFYSLLFSSVLYSLLFSSILYCLPFSSILYSLPFSSLLCSTLLYSMLYSSLAEAIHGFLGQILNSKFHGRRNIWWCWTFVASRIVLDVSRETFIDHPRNISWQAQYLVKLEDYSWCSAPCTGRFMCCCYQTDYLVVLCRTFQYGVILCSAE